MRRSLSFPPVPGGAGEVCGPPRSFPRIVKSDLADQSSLPPTRGSLLYTTVRDPIRLARMVNKMERSRRYQSSNRPHPARPDGEGD